MSNNGGNNFFGIQALGKSTYYKERFFRTHIRISLDLLQGIGGTFKKLEVPLLEEGFDEIYWWR